MSRVGAAAVVPGPVEAARELWFDTSRWPSFVDGFARVVRADPGWPDAGRIVWDSTPHGRGRVSEDADGSVEDERIRGRQTVSFEPAGEGEVLVSVELEYTIKDRTFVTPVVDFLFVRRAMRDALQRTLRRYAIERVSDAEAGGQEFV